MLEYVMGVNDPPPEELDNRLTLLLYDGCIEVDSQFYPILN